MAASILHKKQSGGKAEAVSKLTITAATKGNLLVAYASGNGFVSPEPTFKDNIGGTWTVVSTPAVYGATTDSVWIATKVAEGGETTLEVTASGTVEALGYWETEGLTSTTDVVVVNNNQASTTTPTSGSVTTTHAGDIVFAVVGISSNTGTISAWTGTGPMENIETATTRGFGGSLIPGTTLSGATFTAAIANKLACGVLVVAFEPLEAESRTAASTVSVSSAATRAVSHPRTCSSSITVASTATAVGPPEEEEPPAVEEVATCGQTVTVASAATRATAFARTAATSISVSAAATRSASHPRTALQIITVASVAVSSATAQEASCATSISVSGAASRSLTHPRTAASTIAVSSAAGKSASVAILHKKQSGGKAEAVSELTITAATKGNLLVAYASSNGNTSALTFKDNIGGTWTVVSTPALYASSADSIWIATKVAEGGETSLKVTAGAGAGTVEAVGYWETEGLTAVVDVVVANNNLASTTTPASGSVTTTKPGDIVFAVVGVTSSTGTVGAWTGTGPMENVGTETTRAVGGSLIPGKDLAGATFTASITSKLAAGVLVVAFEGVETEVSTTAASTITVSAAATRTASHPRTCGTSITVSSTAMASTGPPEEEEPPELEEAATCGQTVSISSAATRHVAKARTAASTISIASAAVEVSYVRVWIALEPAGEESGSTAAIQTHDAVTCTTSISISGAAARAAAYGRPVAGAISLSSEARAVSENELIRTCATAVSVSSSAAARTTHTRACGYSLSTSSTVAAARQEIATCGSTVSISSNTTRAATFPRTCLSNVVISSTAVSSVSSVYATCSQLLTVASQATQSRTANATCSYTISLSSVAVGSRAKPSAVRMRLVNRRAVEMEIV